MPSENEVKGAAEPSQFTDTAALDQLATEATVQAPGAQAAPEKPRLTAENCMTEAGMLIGMGMQIIAQKLGVTFDADVKKDGTEKLAAVLAKYDGKLPEWFQKYQEEFQLGMWCAGVAWKCYEEHQDRQRALAKERANAAAAQTVTAS